MKKVLSSLLLILPMFANASSYKTCNDLDKLEYWQKHNLRIAYNHGAPQGLEHTMMAIALMESNAGKWKVNYNSNDFGLFQINIETASRELGITNRFKKMELAELLIYNHDLSANLALRVLNHFDKGNYREMIMSYNEGYRWRKNRDSKKKAEEYYKSISDYVKLLAKCKLV